MTAAGERLTAIASTGARAFPLHDLDWDMALALSENLSRFPAGQSAISFLDTAMMARCVVSQPARKALERQLVLPGRGVLSGLFLRLMGVKVSKRRFSAASFVPALLTYVDRPMRVAVRHADPSRSERLCRSLRQHAPWHEYVFAASETNGHCDLMIVAGRPSLNRGISAEGARSLQANLTIFAGSGLLGLAG